MTPRFPRRTEGIDTDAILGHEWHIVISDLWIIRSRLRIVPRPIVRADYT